MQKKIRYKSRLLDASVAFICISIAALFSFFFWKDLNSYTVRSDKKPIGTITFKQGIAQRKFDDRVVWERVAQSTELYYADTIRTSDFSQAAIHFEDGSVLDIYENSMIQIYWTEKGGLQIDVSDGDIQVDSSEATQAVALTLGDGSQVSIEKGSSLAAKSDSASGINSIEVKSGTALVTTEAGESTSVALGESVSIEKNGGIQRNPITVTSLPKDLKILTLQETSTPVTLSWSTSQEQAGQPIIVQTSREKDFTNPESNVVVNTPSTVLNVSKGVLYWRIFAENAADAPATGKITVEEVSPIVALSPAYASDFRYTTQNPRIAFRWQESQFAEHYVLAVSSTPDMQSEVLSTRTKDTFVSVDTLGEGTYWYQIAPYYALNNLGYAGKSEVGMFTVTKSEALRSPILSAPANASEFSFKEEGDVTFLWKSEISDATYTILVAADENFATPALSTESAGSRFSATFGTSSLPYGTYYWKVIRHSTDINDTFPESDVRTFTVSRTKEEGVRLLYPADGYMIEQGSLAYTQFTWKKAQDDADAQSVFQLSPQSDFSNIVAEYTLDSTSQSGISQASGTYYWRVGILGKDGETRNFSKPYSISVLSPIETAEILSPLPDGEVVVYASSPVQFSWKEAQGADYYSVRVANTLAMETVAQEKVRGTKYSLPLAEGKYTVQVQAVQEGDGSSIPRMGPLSTRSFSVRAPSGIELLLPENGKTIAGLTALQEATVFTWQDGKDKAQSYEFTLTRVLANGSTRIAEKRSIKQPLVSLSRLTAGTYRWTVQASTKDGIPLNSEERTLTIQGIAELSRPVLTEPKEAFVIGPDYLRNHRSITFQWKEVPYATSYRYTLHKKEADGSMKAIISERQVRTNELTLKDLSVLDIGTFVWTVTAYRYASDGYEEQSSKTTRGTFSIDFSVPKKVETVQPGAMYGE